VGSVTASASSVSGLDSGPLELVIFDCDGVLVDSERISARVGASVLRRLGWQVDEAEVLERFLGCSDEYFVTTVEARIGRRLPPGWDREYAPLYEAAYDAELRAVDGVAEVLDRLHGWGVQTCVASNGSHAKLARNLGRAGLDTRLRGRVFSAEDVDSGKPAPDLFLHAAASMGATPSATVVVEDSPPGVTAAMAAGMRCLAYAALTPPILLSDLGGVPCHTMTHVLDRLSAIRSNS
jgi:HAD superfamily hydrolase (TIGR01509 family)